MAGPNMLCSMTVPNDASVPASQPSWVKKVAIKAATLILSGLLLGVAYDWAAPRLYGPERVAGFGLGMAHGALMPVALPSLLMGNDVPIYSPSKTGRIYKIGYIC